MLKSISWNEYFSTLAILLLIYYAAIAYLFFKTEVLALLGIQMTTPTRLSAAPLDEIRESFAKESKQNSVPEPTADVDLSPVIQSFKDEIIAYLTSVAEEQPIKQEVLYAIELIAAKYPVLNDTDCRTELLEYIHRRTEATRPSLLAPQDLKHLFLS